MERKRVNMGWWMAGFGLSLIGNTGCGKAMASGANPPMAAPVSLTVYKNDFGMVSERRPVDLRSGANTIRIAGISRELDPDSVTFRAPDGARVVATTYDLGLSSGKNLMQSLAGKNVELIWNSTDGRPGERIEGILEPAADGGFLLRSGDKVYINPSGTIVAPADSGVGALPGLSVQVRSDRSEQRDLGVSYLTRGLSWSADYVARLDADSARLDLECWASVTNRTGVPFRDATISFVAGEPNRAVQSEMKAQYDRAEFAAAKAPADLARDMSVSAPEAIGELYQYKAKDPATIGTDQINRVQMFNASAIPVRLDYSVRLPEIYAWGDAERAPHLNAQLAIEFDNRSGAGLGLPMPAGAVRILQRDGQEDRYTGAAGVSDVPVGGHISLTLSKVFDVTAEPTLVSNKRIDKHTTRRTVRVLLRNSKERDVEVRLVQGIYGRWQRVSGDSPVKLDANTAQWKIQVPGRGTATMECTMDIRG